MHLKSSWKVRPCCNVNGSQQQVTCLKRIVTSPLLPNSQMCTEIHCMSHWVWHSGPSVIWQHGVCQSAILLMCFEHMNWRQLVHKLFSHVAWRVHSGPLISDSIATVRVQQCTCCILRMSSQHVHVAWKSTWGLHDLPALRPAECGLTCF